MPSEDKIVLPEKKVGRRSGVAKVQYSEQMQRFADALIKLDKIIAIKEGVSSRGWCYLLEGMKLIDKSQFDLVQDLINECRKEGYLPIDFCAIDETRSFDNVEALFNMDYKSPFEYLMGYLSFIRDSETYKKDISYWESQTYYIQMFVEKIDVFNLFKGTCEKYHIPIANAKGWSDLNSRNILVKRFKEAEENGLKTVLLYYGDFDPAGILIADTIKTNLEDIQKATEYNPQNLVIERFGLTFDFITANNLLWIDNLITGSKKDLSDPKHADFKKPYVQEYIVKYGKRKCEANAILPIRDIALNDCEKAIQKYLGTNPNEKYNEKITEEQKKVKLLMDKIDFKKKIDDLMKSLVLQEAKNSKKSNHDRNFDSADENEKENSSRDEQNLEFYPTNCNFPACVKGGQECGWTGLVTLCPYYPKKENKKNLE